MTTTDPTSAPMCGPLSEADRLAEIQARLDAVVPAGPWEVFDNGGTTNIVGEGGDPYVAHIGNSSWPGTEEMAMFIANSPADIKFLLRLVGVLEGQLATAQAEVVQLNSQLKDPGLDWLIDWAMGTDREARDHYFHINDGEGDSCGCRYADEGALGLDGGGSDAKTQQGHATAPDTAMDEFEAADDLSRRWE